MLWNLLAGYGGHGQRSASRPSSASAPTRCSPLGILARLEPGASPFLLGAPRRAGWSRCPSAFLAFRLQGALLRHRHLGHRRGDAPELVAQWKTLGGGTGTLAAARGDRQHPRRRDRGGCSSACDEAAARDSVAYWLALGLRGRGGRRSSTLLLRSRRGLALLADPRQHRGGRCRSACRCPAHSSSIVFRRRGFGDRARRRARTSSADGCASRPTRPSALTDWTCLRRSSSW
jgi:hypothetical protein